MSKVLLAAVQLTSYGAVVCSDSLSELLVEGTGLQTMFCCLTASIARALLCVVNAEFRV